MSAIGSKLILFGGLSANGNGSWLNDLHILDTDTAFGNSYTTAAHTAPSAASHYSTGVLSWYQPVCHGSPPPCPRAAHSAAVIGSTLFIFAGNDGKQLFNDLHCLHLPTLTWSVPQQHGHVPSPRAGHTMNVLPGERLIVFGGRQRQRTHQRPPHTRHSHHDVDEAQRVRHAALTSSGPHRVQRVQR